MVVFAVMTIAISISTKAQRASDLEDLAQRLNGARVSLGATLFGGETLHDARVHGGSYEGHDVDVRYERRGGKNKVTYAHVEVRVENPVAGFRIEPAGTMNRLGRWLGVVSDTKIGNERVDDRFILSGRPDALQSLFARGDAERALGAIFNGEGGDEVELSGTTLRARVRTHGVNPDKVMIVVRHLVALARLCDRKPVEIKILGPKPKFVWTGGTEQALCPYCRDQVDPDGSLALDACERCDTVHHAECLSEAGGCTVFGCGGGRERSRA
jgi:hypothetical protein